MVVSKPRTKREIAGSAGDPLGQLFWYLGRAYYNYVGLLERILAEEGLDEHVQPGMGPILFTLFEQDGRSIKEISARSQLACSTLTGLLDRMAKTGLVKRCRDELDGRVIRIRLTALGRSYEPRCVAVVKKIDEILSQALNDSEVRQAKELLRRMTETMRGNVP